MWKVPLKTNQTKPAQEHNTKRNPAGSPTPPRPKQEFLSPDGSFTPSSLTRAQPSHNRTPQSNATAGEVPCVGFCSGTTGNRFLMRGGG